MNKMIFASKNKGKIKEIKMIFKDTPYSIISLDEAFIKIEVIEDKDSFEGNAIKKATEVMEESGITTIADDSGLEIDYLNKAPGVYSARYLGENTPYTEKNAKILDMLKNVPDEKRTARFVSIIAVAFPDRKIITARGVIEGKIGYESRGNNGFGYDPIFYIDDYKKSMAEITPEEKNLISHRGKALMVIKEKLKQV